MQKMRRYKYIILLSIILSGVLSFQNCGSQEFSDRVLFSEVPCFQDEPSQMPKMTMETSEIKNDGRERISEAIVTVEDPGEFIKLLWSDAVNGAREFELTPGEMNQKLDPLEFSNTENSTIENEISLTFVDVCNRIHVKTERVKVERGCWVNTEPTITWPANRQTSDTTTDFVINNLQDYNQIKINFGDGSPEVVATPANIDAKLEHTYTGLTPGQKKTYTITVVFKNRCGEWSQPQTKDIEITGEPPPPCPSNTPGIGAITGPAFPRPGDEMTVNFTNASGWTTVNVNVEYIGDLAASNPANPTKFNQPANNPTDKNIKVTATFKKGTNCSSGPVSKFTTRYQPLKTLCCPNGTGYIHDYGSTCQHDPDGVAGDNGSKNCAQNLVCGDKNDSYKFCGISYSPISCRCRGPLDASPPTPLGSCTVSRGKPATLTPTQGDDACADRFSIDDFKAEPTSVVPEDNTYRGFKTKVELDAYIDSKVIGGKSLREHCEGTFPIHGTNYSDVCELKTQQSSWGFVWYTYCKAKNAGASDLNSFACRQGCTATYRDLTSRSTDIKWGSCAP